MHLVRIVMGFFLAPPREVTCVENGAEDRIPALAADLDVIRVVASDLRVL